MSSSWSVITTVQFIDIAVKRATTITFYNAAVTIVIITLGPRRSVIRVPHLLFRETHKTI